MIFYAAVFTVVELIYFFYVRHRNRTLKSSLIQFDNISWLVDAMLSAGLLVSFLIALLLKTQGYEKWALYVDPMILILLALGMLPPAFKILGPALRDVLGIAPDQLDDKVRQVMEEAKIEHGFDDYVSYRAEARSGVFYRNSHRVADKIIRLRRRGATGCATRKSPRSSASRDAAASG